MFIYITALIVLVILLVAHLLGIDGWYYRFESYDTLMHFIGGVGMAFFVSAMIRSHSGSASVTYKNVFIGVLIAAIGWELFEMYYEITGDPLWSTAYYFDTVKDIIMAILGGFVVTYLLNRKE